MGKQRDLAKGAEECQPGNEFRVRDGFAGWLFNVVTRIPFDLEIQSGSNSSGPHRTRFRRTGCSRVIRMPATAASMKPLQVSGVFCRFLVSCRTKWTSPFSCWMLCSYPYVEEFFHSDFDKDYERSPRRPDRQVRLPSPPDGNGGPIHCQLFGASVLFVSLLLLLLPESPPP